MKKSIILLVILSVALPCLAKAPKVNLDAAQFRYDSTSSLWEFYYSFPDTTLKYVSKEGSQIGGLAFNVKINASERNINDISWIAENKFDVNKPTGQVNLILGVKVFALEPGQYNVVIRISDLNDSSSKAKVEFPLIINNYNKKGIALSDVEIAQIIERETEATRNWDPMFRKNGLIVVPNPSLDIIGVTPALKLYTEIYNASGGESEMNYIIFDGAKREVFHQPKKLKAPSNAIVDLVDLPLEILPSGIYYLKLELSKDGDTASSFKKFYILNPNMPAESDANFSENEAFELSEFATLSEEKTELEWRQAKVIATESEREQWEKIEEPVAKRRYLYRFWFIRDPDPKTKINERLESFRKSIEYASTYFKFGNKKEGWETERGKILLKYGIPTQRNVHTADQENKPYEEWIYDNVQSGATFYFVDTIGAGNYRLVHSTARGEISDPNWQQDYLLLDKRSKKNNNGF